MRHSALSALLLSATIAAQQAPTGFGPFSDPAYRFLPSIEAAVQAARGSKPVVVYSVFSTAVRDRVEWLDRQQRLWSDTELANVLQGIPLVAVNPGDRKHKELGLPQLGFVVFKPDGKTRLDTIQIQRATDAQIVASIRKALKEHAGTKAERAPLRHERSPSQALRERREHRRERASAFWKALPQLRAARSQVVVVGDESGFLEALAGWDQESIYPILFADSRYLPKFLSAYAPEKIWVQRSPRKELQVNRAALQEAWLQAIGAGKQDAAELWKTWKSTPDRSPGLVVLSPKDPMWPAGLALAAARRQAWIELDPVADPQKLVPRDDVIALRNRLEGILSAADVEWSGLYDEIDFVTLASAQPYRYRDSSHPDKTPYAVDDLLTRDGSELRWAHVGRLLGSREQALYQAMCSLFLESRDALLFSRYGKNAEPWKTYDTTDAAALLRKHFEMQEISHPAATRSRWHELFRAADGRWGLVHVNSSGGTRDWSTSKGKANFDDIWETVPAIVSYTHSTSAGAPYHDDTIAARWLERGAFFYFGSSHEPYLDAFVPIDLVYRRALEEGIPLGAAFRWRAGERRWRPWKLACFGDPLRRLLPERRKRLPAQSDGVRTFGPEMHIAGRKDPWNRGRSARALEEAWCSRIASFADRNAGQDSAAKKRLRGLKRLRVERLDAEQKRQWADLVALELRWGAPRQLGIAAVKAGLDSRDLGLAIHDRARREQLEAVRTKDPVAFEAAIVLHLHARLKGTIAKTAGKLLRERCDALSIEEKERKELHRRMSAHELGAANVDLLSGLR